LTKYKTFTLGEFEVFGCNLENAAKVPGDIGRSKSVQGVWLGFWPLVDQGVSLGFVGEVFEVMTQVDRRLTKVNSVDRIIRVNKPGWKPGASHSCGVSYSSEWRVLFIAVGGRWSTEAAGARHGRTSRCGRIYDLPPFIMDDPDALSLVGCESVSWVGSAGFHAL
jgi:hypothetical protein